MDLELRLFCQNSEVKSKPRSWTFTLTKFKVKDKCPQRRYIYISQKCFNMKATEGRPQTILHTIWTDYSQINCVYIVKNHKLQMCLKGFKLLNVYLCFLLFYHHPQLGNSVHHSPYKNQVFYRMHIDCFEYACYSMSLFQFKHTILKTCWQLACICNCDPARVFFVGFLVILFLFPVWNTCIISIFKLTFTTSNITGLPRKSDGESKRESKTGQCEGRERRCWRRRAVHWGQDDSKEQMRLGGWGVFCRWDVIGRGGGWGIEGGN